MTTTNTTDTLPTRNCIVFWYHDADLALLQVLDPYLQQVYRRFPSIHPIYSHYPRTPLKAPTPPTGTAEYWVKEYKESKAKYEQACKLYEEERTTAARHLQQYALLFVPCISNAFIEQLWADSKRDATLRTLLEHPDFQILPVLLRPTGTEAVSMSDPLCAYEGYALELACQQIAARIEAVIINSGYEPESTPLTTLFSSPATIHLTIPPQRNATVEAFAPVKALLEQASTQITESRQAAIAERSQRLAVEESTQTERQVLQEQMKEMKQQLMAIQKEQQARLFSRMSRWLGLTSATQ